MNLFIEYQKKIFKSIKELEKKGLIKVPSNLKSFTVELPPKNQNADLSCNAALIMSKINNTSPKELAEILKKQSTINKRYLQPRSSDSGFFR